MSDINYKPAPDSGRPIAGREFATQTLGMLGNINNASATAGADAASAVVIAGNASQQARQAQSDIDSHKIAKGVVHGATPAPSKDRIVMRDESGRAQVLPPAADGDITNKKYVDDAVQSSVSYTDSRTQSATTTSWGTTQYAADEDITNRSSVKTVTANQLQAAHDRISSIDAKYNTRTQPATEYALGLTQYATEEDIHNKAADRAVTADRVGSIYDTIDEMKATGGISDSTMSGRSLDNFLYLRTKISDDKRLLEMFGRLMIPSAAAVVVKLPTITIVNDSGFMGIPAEGAGIGAKISAQTRDSITVGLINSSGAWVPGVLSFMFKGVIDDSNLPPAPEEFKVNAVSDALSASWNAVPGAISYTLYRSASAYGPFGAVLDGITSTPVNFTGYLGTSYYKISSTTINGESPLSAAVQVAVVGKPAALSTVNENDTVYINIGAAAYATHITVERSTDNVNWILDKTVTAGTASYFTPTAFQGNMYFRSYGSTANSKGPYSDVYQYVAPVLGAFTMTATQINDAQVRVDWTTSSGPVFTYWMGVVVNGAQVHDIHSIASTARTYTLNLASSAVINMVSEAGFTNSPTATYNFVYIPLPKAPAITSVTASGTTATVKFTKGV